MYCALISVSTKKVREERVYFTLFFFSLYVNRAVNEFTVIIHHHRDYVGVKVGTFLPDLHPPIAVVYAVKKVFNMRLR